MGQLSFKLFCFLLCLLANPNVVMGANSATKINVVKYSNKKREHKKSIGWVQKSLKRKVNRKKNEFDCGGCWFWFWSLFLLGIAMIIIGVFFLFSNIWFLILGVFLILLGPLVMLLGALILALPYMS